MYGYVALRNVKVKPCARSWFDSNLIHQRHLKGLVQIHKHRGDAPCPPESRQGENVQFGWCNLVAQSSGSH